MNKQGFSSLFVIIILASLVFFILVVVEVTAGFSSRSVAEDICLITGESLLSEYQTDLFESYGLLAMQSFNEKLSRMAKFYIESSLDSGGANILKMRLVSCNVNAEKYPALDVDLLSSQIKAVALAMMAKDMIDRLDFSDSLSKIKTEAESSEAMKNTLEEQMQSLDESLQATRDSQEGEESDEAKKTAKQVKRLLRQYKDFTQIQNSSGFELKAIESPEIIMSLPSQLLGILQRRNILSTCVDLNLYADSWIENEYILNRCSYATAIKQSTYRDLEAEYILYGRFSCKENEKAVRSSLFWLRSALNLAHIYSDNQKKTEVTALASSAFSLVPLPVAVFAIASIWAAIEAKNDLNLLFDNQCVPFFKKESDWKSSLSGVAEGDATSSSDSGASTSIGMYDDYLRLFLLSLPKCEKLARLMDVIQLNIANKMGRNFCFQDYAYGFSLTASFEKSAHLPGNSFVSDRTGSVVQEHAY